MRLRRRGIESKVMSKEAVVIIDLQNAILDIPGMKRQVETYAALDALLIRISALVRRARERDIPILFVQHDGPVGHRLERGSPGWQIRPEITPVHGDPVIHKSACDSFFETTLTTELTSRGIGALIVAGCMTQYCVDTTVRRAVSLGYDVTLVGDGHMTADSDALTYEQIIAHHNLVLDGLDAGKHAVRILPLHQILL